MLDEISLVSVNFRLPLCMLVELRKKFHCEIFQQADVVGDTQIKTDIVMNKTKRRARLFCRANDFYITNNPRKFFTNDTYLATIHCGL